MTGQLIGIAVRGERRAPTQTLDMASVTCTAGVDGDHKGRKFKKAAGHGSGHRRLGASPSGLGDFRPVGCFAVDRQAGKSVGSGFAFTTFCWRRAAHRADCGDLRDGANVAVQAHGRGRPWLRKALHPDWRGGVTAQVLTDGRVQLGDPVEILSSPPERTRKLL
ncbi:MAG: hypothetical protein AAF732_21305 [Pseudomonadota bacterium]